MKQHIAIISHIFTAISELPYRIPRFVVDFRSFHSITEYYTYPVCPRCKTTMEREYMAYCSRCGQKLDWSRYLVNDGTIF